MEKWKKKIGEIWDKIKAAFGKIPEGVRKWIVTGAVVLILGAVAIALLLNHKEYSVLYSEVTQEDAAAIGQKLQEMGAEYQLKSNGDIVVLKEQEDGLRAALAYEGYPKSGFSYDVFINNTGGMTTDSDADTYKLYELQNRLGATISLFDGVKDAKVTIALGEKQKYVLQSAEDNNQASASVVVQMKSGKTLSPQSASGIRNLVAHSVAGLDASNVSVFDENGIELSAEEEGLQGENASELTREIENEIAAKVANLLAPVYGSDNVRVSVKASVNMERLIRESITYTTPDKIDAQDKQGIVSREKTENEQGQQTGAEGGVAGAETNADISNYNTVNGGGDESYSASASEKEYLVNQTKEQGEINPGVLDDLSISAVINSDAGGGAQINQDQLKALIGNAAGMSPEEQGSKITVLFAPFARDVITPQSSFDRFVEEIEENWYLLAIGCAAFFFLIVLFMLLSARRRKRRRLKEEKQRLQQAAKEKPVEINPEIANIKNEEAMNMRQNVREFTEQNPEIAAQLLKEWLGGGTRNE